MAVKFNLDEKVLDQLRSVEVQSKIGSEIVRQMKQFVLAGKSPVAGVGRFEGYKAAESRKAERKAQTQKRQVGKAISATRARSSTGTSGYPFSVLAKFPDKRVRPVNLKLTGKMIQALIFKVGRNGPQIGIFDENEALIAETHNDGTQEGKVPQRKFIPNKKGDELVVSIMRAIKAIYSQELDAIIKRSNAK